MGSPVNLQSIYPLLVLSLISSWQLSDLGTGQSFARVHSDQMFKFVYLTRRMFTVRGRPSPSPAFIS